MKFAKTFCSPSSTISVVPVGIPVKLQYNEHGLLQKCSVGFNETLDPQFEDQDALKSVNYNEFFQAVKSKVPNSIRLEGGTTWVYGIIYSHRIPCTEGILPQCAYPAYIQDLINGGSYEFYAGYVYSLAASFRGPLVIRNFLGSAKFNTLPQLLVPLTMTEEAFNTMISPTSYPFNRSFIAGFIIFEGTDCRFVPANLKQITVTKEPKLYVDEDGYMKGKVVDESKEEYVFSYSALLHHEVTKGCSLLLEADSDSSIFSIRTTRVGDSVEKVINTALKEIKCPICGKVIFSGITDAPMQCDDPHCLSHLYADANKMLKTLELPAITYTAYRQMVDKKEIICLPDILDTKVYKDAEITTSLANAMYSVIPAEVVPDFNIIQKFANKCNNTVETVVYYLENPLRIETDLDITDPLVYRLVKWLEDPYNVSTLTSLFARVKIARPAQKYEASPIFRGNKIALTGRFKRGDYPEIESILLSYAATVYPSMDPGDPLPDVLITGSTNECISGLMIQRAKAHNIPIIEEDDFFARYGIDQDMSQNLL